MEHTSKGWDEIGAVGLRNNTNGSLEFYIPSQVAQRYLGKEVSIGTVKSHRLNIIPTASIIGTAYVEIACGRMKFPRRLEQ